MRESKEQTDQIQSNNNQTKTQSIQMSLFKDASIDSVSQIVNKVGL